MRAAGRVFALGAAALATGFAFSPIHAAEPPVPPMPVVQGRIAPKIVVVANFEPGKDMGDEPGEFQLWAEREHLDEEIVVRGVLHPLRRNAGGVYGIVWGDAGTMVSGVGEQLSALLLDPRFDFSRTYWLFTGISGGDPNLAPVGSAAWARWVVQGDTLREFDDREVAKDWPYGLFAIGADRPNALPADPKSFAGYTDTGKLSMVQPLNQGLARWAYARTKDIAIPDTPALRKQRALWKGYPNAQRPPFVLMGETLGSVRYWHGPGRLKWAEDWVKLWTGGRGVFAMSNMESQSMAGAMNVAAKAGLVDLDRVMVLRTASNQTMPPPGHSAVESVGDEGPGQRVAYEANYRVGAPVVHEIVDHWDLYRDHIPSAPEQ
ncbi:MAG: purine nucleoside permease [Sphingomonas sp.]|nr:MAG: purine nucleoside permease [Sphingomonas sp.]